MRPRIVSKHLLSSAGMVLFFVNTVTYGPAFAQAIHVSSNADTVYVVSGCTPPEVVFALEREDDLFDSLTIKPGFNTVLSVGDSVGGAGVLGIISLLVENAGSPAYRLDFEGISRTDSYSIDPDSTCWIRPALFRMIFRVLKDGASIDSAEWVAIVRQVPLSARNGDEAGCTSSPAVCSYPNPFNPTTIIRYTLPGKGVTSIKIYDAVGREVESLVNEMQDAGVYEVRHDGSSLSSGVYFMRMDYNGRVITDKMVLMR